MIKITSQELKNLAKISRIALKKEEAEKLLSEIDAVLEYASTLVEVAAMDHEKADSVYEGNIFREDSIIDVNPEPILQQAPERDGDYFVVPRIIKQT